MTARCLTLIRTEPGPSDETKPTGIVAEAAVYSDGTAVLHWLTSPGATEVYASEEDMRAIREFSGRSRFYEDSGAASRSTDDADCRITVTVDPAGASAPGDEQISEPRTLADAVAALRAAMAAGHEYACLELTLARIVAANSDTDGVL
jgi:hypothetical protein